MVSRGASFTFNCREKILETAVSKMMSETREINPQSVIHAVASKDFETVNFLISRGADPNLTDQRRTPILCAAAKDGQHQSARYKIDSTSENVEARAKLCLCQSRHVSAS